MALRPHLDQTGDLTSELSFHAARTPHLGGAKTLLAADRSILAPDIQRHRATAAAASPYLRGAVHPLGPDSCHISPAVGAPGTAGTTAELVSGAERPTNRSIAAIVDAASSWR